MKMHPRPRLGVAATALLTLVVAGCGDGAGSDAAAEPPDDREPIEVTLRDYAFVDLPETVAAGTRLTVTNEAQAELHELVAFRLPDDEERSLEELIQLSPHELEAAFGGPPATVILAAPGGEAITAVGDGTLTEPGRYAIMCFIPTGAEPEEYLEAAAQQAPEDGPPEVAGGPPHFVHGMYTTLIVE